MSDELDKQSSALDDSIEQVGISVDGLELRILRMSKTLDDYIQSNGSSDKLKKKCKEKLLFASLRERE